MNVLLTERRGHILILRLNRPEARNALNPELIEALGQAFLQAGQDSAIRGIVLTGTGDRAFCAGMDLRSFAQGGRPTDGDPEAFKAFSRFTDGQGAPVPVVGAAQATAVAGGFELLLACDLVVAAEDARFGLPEVKRGLMAAGGGVFIGSRLPLAVALELTMTGDTLDARRAYELGLVNRLVPAGEVLDTGIGLAETIARNGPMAVRLTREIVRASSEDMARARRLLKEAGPKVFASNDAKEGATAFIERRDPVWTGT